MAKIVFLVLSILASIAALGFGYMTYQKIGEVDHTLTLTKKDLADTKTTLQKTQFTLKDTQDQLTATKTQLDTANETIKTTQAKLDDVTAQLTTAQQQLTDAQGKLDDANKALAALQAATGHGGGTGPGTGVEQIVSDLKAQVAELTQVKASLTQKADEADKRADDLAKKIAEHDRLVSTPGIEGMVMAVNPGWNFVVISIGDHQGAVPNEEALVKRGDTLIAKLRITTVEALNSIADIVPDSLAKGQRVLPGDKVIFTAHQAAQ